jgi:hypothetical protein
MGLAALAAAGGSISSASLAAEGLRTNDQVLLRGAISDCASGEVTCDAFAQRKSERAGSASVGLRIDHPADVNDAAYGYPVGSVPHFVEEASPPPFDLDWSVGLRGAYVNNSTTGARYEALISPNATLSYEGSRTRVIFGAGADVSRSSTDALRLGALRMSLDADYKFDRDMQIENRGVLSFTQASPDDPSLATGVIEAPLTFVGSLDSTLTRRFGRLDVALRGNLERDVYGDSTLAGQIKQDNTSSNRSVVGGGLRLSYALTPIIKVFVDGDAAHDTFDAISPSLGVKADGTSYAVRSGLSGQWGERLSAEASIGFGLRRFDASALDEVTAMLYDARVVYKPDGTLTLTGAFTTRFTPPGPNGSGTTRVDHIASADVNYRVNSWLALRALANWSSADLSGTGGTERGYGLGVGADYLVNSHTTVNADYGFSHSETASNPNTDEHRVTLGVTISR